MPASTRQNNRTMTMDSAPAKGREAAGLAQCHFISNTHWDREWRYSAQRTRHMLGYLLDMLFDIFEKEPKFKYFHLDSQTLPLQDYLELYPEKAPLVKKYVSEGRLQVGPWFSLPDEFCVSGESLIRNLLLGHKIARQFGQVSKTGYSPFGWGQISQMPQIYQGFGIDFAAFYRGINTIVAPKSEFYWESPDGTRIIGSRLGARPRYNIWYVVQRPVYWDEKDENQRVTQWGRGHGLFRFADEENADLDYQYCHPQYGYHTENLPAKARQALQEQDNDWATPHRFWSAGHDISCPDIREARLIDDCRESLAGSAEVFHSTFKALQDGIKANARPDWPVLTGEMRHPFTKGSVSPLLGWVLSSRTNIKQDNFRTERALTSFAEPLAVFASLLGAPWPGAFIDQAYNWLLQNHGHDSIGACGRDILYEDMLFRSRQSREISQCVMERAVMDIAGDIDLSKWPKGSMALVALNPAPFTRTEVVNAVLEIPVEWKGGDIEIADENGKPLATQAVEKVSPFHQVVQSPNDVATLVRSTHTTLRVEFPDVPAMGYRAFAVRPKISKPGTPQSMCPGPQRMENEFLSVSINANGTYDLLDKQRGRLYVGLGYLRDSGETGNPWEHIPPQNDTLYTTLGSRAEVTRVRDGGLEASYKVAVDWALPAGRSQDGLSRGGLMKPCRVVNTLTLRKGQPWLEVSTELDNQSEDHYLQVSFPTGLKGATQVQAQGQFDVVSRDIAKPDYSKYDETPMTEHPMNSFVDLADGQAGLALLNEGLKAYEAHGDLANTLSLTLLRCYPLRIWTSCELQDHSQTDKGSQCLGRQSFRYAIMPHGGDWEKGRVWQASERFNLRFHAVQVEPTRHGKNPRALSFLELKQEGLHVSAVKRSEDGQGWVVRLFNPSPEGKKNALRLNRGFSSPAGTQSPVERVQAEFELPSKGGGPWSKVRLVSLEEKPEKDLDLDQEGWVAFEIGFKKILTLEFIP